MTTLGASAAGVAAGLPTPVRRIVFVSDFHLSEGGWGAEPDPIGDAAEDAFVALAGSLRESDGAPGPDGSRSRLVLLGDTFELLDGDRLLRRGGGRSVAGRLHAIAEAHRPVLDALAALVSAGWDLHVVPGNHDMELAFADVQALLRRELFGSEAPNPALSVDPWIHFVPGMVYAEHGSQYHDLNAFTSALSPSLTGDPRSLDHPIGAYLDAASRDPAQRPLALARAAAVYGRDALAGRSARAAHASRRSDALAEYAAEVGLSAESVVAIDALSRRGLPAVARRAPGVAAGWIAARAARRRGVAAPYEPAYLHAAARSIDRILRRSGEAVPCYVFGHSHVAERLPLDPGGAEARAVLVGTGTWTRNGPRGADLPSRRGAYPWVEVARDDDGGVETSVRTWGARAADVAARP